MEAIEEFFLLGIAPLVAAPLQALYMKAGARYDLGVSFTLATGFVLGVMVIPGARTEQIGPLHLTLLLLFLALVTMIRILVLAYSPAMRFTIVSIAQMWAVVPLLNYFLLHLGTPSGLYIGQIAEPLPVITFAAALSSTAAYFIFRQKLWPKLRSLTEERNMFRILIGSPLLLAAKLEFLSLFMYLTAGILLRLVRQNLAAPDFGREAIWIVLVGALTPLMRISRLRGTGRYLLLLTAPLVGVLARYGLRHNLPASIADAAAYACLALVLLISMSISQKGQVFVRA